MGEVIPETYPIEYGVDCDYCIAGETPKYLTLTITELTGCITYANEECLGTCWSNVLDAINSTFRLVQNPLTPCVWELNPAGTIHYDEYTEDCTVYVGSVYRNFGIFVSKILTDINIQIAFPSGGPPYYCFVATAIVKDGCAGANNIPNELPYICSIRSLAGSGGIATIRDGD